MHPTGPHLGPDVLFRESNMKVTLTFNEQRRAAYRQQGLWGDASLADYWQQTARAMPDKIAVVDNHGASYNYSALDHAASCLANWMLAKGIESGDRIAFQLPGWCEFTVIYLACLKIGAVSVPLLPSWREAELVWVLNKCQAKMFFAPTLFKQTRPVDLILPLQNQLPQLQQIVGVDKLAPATSSLSLSQIIADNTPLTTAITTHGDELAAVLFTSGTEGLPKGVMLTHNNILASERAYCARLNLTWQDVFMMPAPLGHATGFLHGVTAPFLIGARSVLLDIFTPDACLALLEQQRCTCMLGATPFVYDLLNVLEKQPADLSALRFFLCGGTTIPKKVARECQQLGIKLLMKIYVIKIAVHGVSPMVWRRLRIAADTSLAALHFIFQIVQGWGDDHLHQFHIYGKDYGISYEGGIGFVDNPFRVVIDDFAFDAGDRFTYEYNFFEHWLHDIRVEAIYENSTLKAPFCISGHGMPGATAADEFDKTLAFLEAIVNADDETTVGEIRPFADDLDAVRFNRHKINRQLSRLDLASPVLEPEVIWLGRRR
ncbi:TPA: AMP-binding protein [Escherichia coli]|nr:AMP-binding protein [Escherichia coli]